MAAYDFNRRQTVFMSFRVILSQTLSSFPCEDTHVQGSANARRMPAIIANLTWMIYLGQSRARAHHALQPRIMKLVKMLSLNTLIAPCIYTDCRQLSSWKGRVNPVPNAQALRAHCNLVLLDLWKCDKKWGNMIEKIWHTLKESHVLVFSNYNITSVKAIV